MTKKTKDDQRKIEKYTERDKNDQNEIEFDLKHTVNDHKHIVSYVVVVCLLQSGGPTNCRRGLLPT